MADMDMRFIGLLAIGLAIAPSLGQAAQDTAVCRAPDDLSGPIVSLPRVAAVLKPGGHLRILAVGSATMFGLEATLQPGTLTSQALDNAATPTIPPPGPALPPPTDDAFPNQMAAALRAAIPGLQVDVVLKGGRGLSSADMLAIMRQELATDGVFQLVLWQTGTVEVVRNTPPAQFAAVLHEGAKAAQAADANLVLIDPQFTRFLEANSNLAPYAQAMRTVAASPGVMLFRRYDLMRAWASSGQIDLERTPRADRRQAVIKLHTCIGDHLARMVRTGAQS